MTRGPGDQGDKVSGTDRLSLQGAVAWLLVTAGLPFLLCSGMTALIGGRELTYKVVGTILGLYLVVACCWVVNWLFLRSPDSERELPRNETHREGQA